MVATAETYKVCDVSFGIFLLLAFHLGPLCSFFLVVDVQG